MGKLKKILDDCAGIDVGSEKVFVATEVQPVRSFRTFTNSYKELIVFFKENNIKRVAMEATGIYWVTLYDMLEEAGFEVYLVNPADSKNYPGRKTDVQDCQWILQLFSYGLLRKSFVPTDYTRKLRVFTRLREDHIQMASAHVQHMQKSLIQMNIRIPEVLSQTNGKSGLAMIEAILKGVREPEKLLSFCDGSLQKRKPKEILAALNGNYKDEYLFALRQAFEAYMFYKEQMRGCEKEMEILLEQITSDLAVAEGTNKNVKGKPTRHNMPKIKNLHEKLVKLNHVDPTVLPGITDYSFLRLTAEIGTNLHQWPTEKHFTSWLGLAPGKNESGKMHKKAKKRMPTRAGQIFRSAAVSLLNSKNFSLGAFARKLRGKKGPAIAIKATARKLAILYYNLFTKGMEYIERGIKQYEEKLLQKQKEYVIKKAKELNLQLADYA
jgi:transposase